VTEQLRGIARRIAGLELWIMVLGVTPVLIFDAWMPRWLIVVALASIVALWLLRWFGCGSPVRPTPLDLPILILLLMVPVGVWAAAVRSPALPELYRIVLGIALLYAVVGTVSSARALRLVGALLLPATAALSLAALLGTVWAKGKLPQLEAVYQQLPTLLRPFWNPAGFSANIVGGILAVLLPVTIAYALGSGRLWLKGAWAMAFLAGGLVLLLTQSRGAFVALSIALLVMGAARTRWFLVAIPVLGAGVLAAVQSLGGSQLSQVLLSSSTSQAVGSLEGRLELWSRALYMIQDFPVTGIGLGMFDRVLDLLYPLFLVGPAADLFHPHDIYLAAAVDGGLPALIAFVSLLVLLLFMAVQSVRFTHGDRLRPLAYGLLGGVVAYMTHGLFDSITSFIKASTIIWAFFGLETALWLCLHDRIKTDAQAGPHIQQQVSEIGHVELQATSDNHQARE
jgi:putative inorganic carbon (HCO3(-)) transporter